MTHQAKLLQETMANIQMAYFASRPLGNLRVHEGDGASITIDLYNFEGDGKDVCDGLEFDTLTLPDGVTIHVKAFAISYDPDLVEHPLIFSCTDIAEETDFNLSPDYVPETTLANITTWLWNTVKQSEQRSVWLRIGVTVTGTVEEIEALFQEEGSDEALKKLLDNKQYEFDGDTYIPGCCVETYNEEYHTEHGVDDYEFNIN